MERAGAEKLARELMLQWDCSEWEFRWSRGKRQLGCASCRINTLTGEITERQLRLSRHLVDLNDEATVRDVILHEIAHIKAGPKNGHNKVWKEWCRKVGAKPQRCASPKEVNLPPARLHIVCPSCGKASPRQRRPSPSVLKRIYCRDCGKKATLGKMRLQANG